MPGHPFGRLLGQSNVDALGLIETNRTVDHCNNPSARSIAPYATLEPAHGITISSPTPRFSASAGVAPISRDYRRGASTVV